jgi:type VI secretion system protein ImpC
LVIGVLAGLSGNRPAVRPRPFADRRFVSYDLDDFLECMQCVRPGLALQVPNLLSGSGTLNVELSFASMEDFAPGPVALQVEPCRCALAALSKLKPLQGTTPPENQAEIARQVLDDLNVDIPLTEEGGLAAAIRAIEAGVAGQVELVRQQPEFHALESAWRGLHYLVRQARPDRMVRVKVLNATKLELLKDLEKAVEFDQSQLFKKVYEQEFGTAGGEPFGLLIADYHLDLHPDDRSLVEKMSAIGAAAYSPVVMGLSPSFLQIEEWQDLNQDFDPSWCVGGTWFATWRSFAESQDARFAFFVMPRVAECRTGASDADPPNGTSAVEVLPALRVEGPIWFNAGYALAANIARTYRESGGRFAPVDGPRHGRVTAKPRPPRTRTVPAQAEQQAPEGDVPLITECSVSPEFAARLRSLGLNAVVSSKDATAPYLLDLRPWDRFRANGPIAGGVAAESPLDLAALLCAGRLAHVVRCILREKRGPEQRGPWVSDADSLAAEMDSWLQDFVQADPCTAAQHARRPLASGCVVCPDPDQAVYWVAARLAGGFSVPYPAISVPCFRACAKGAKEVRQRLQMIVVADLAGHAIGEHRPARDRKPLVINADNFNEVMGRFGPRLRLAVPNKLSGTGDLELDLLFRSLCDFEPEEVARQSGPLQELLDQRSALVDLAIFAGVSKQRSASLDELVRSGDRLEALIPNLETWADVSAEKAGPPAGIGGIRRDQGPCAFLADPARCERLNKGLDLLHHWGQAGGRHAALGGLLAIRCAVRGIDELLSCQLNAIMHHPGFRELEARYRGLKHVADRVRADGRVVLAAFLLNPQELADAVGGPADVNANSRENPLHGLRMALETHFEEEPRTVCVALDHLFGPGSDDAFLLAGFCKWLAGAGAFCAAGVSPGFLGCTAWEELCCGNDVVAKAATLEDASWRSWQKSPCDNALLTLPGFVVRAPYAPQEGRWAGFQFAEDVKEGDGVLRANAAYLLAAQILTSAEHRDFPHVPARQSTELDFPLGEVGSLLGKIRDCFSRQVTNFLLRNGLAPLTADHVRVVLRAPRPAE